MSRNRVGASPTDDVSELENIMVSMIKEARDIGNLLFKDLTQVMEFYLTEKSPVIANALDLSGDSTQLSPALVKMAKDVDRKEYKSE